MRFLLIFLLSSLALTDPTQPVEKLPPGLSLSLHQDVNYNNRFPVSELGKSAGSTAPIPIYSADVPLESVLQTQSKFLSLEMKGFFQVEHDGKKYVRFYSRNPISVGNWDTEKGIRVGPTLRGAKLTSHATHLVWDPAAPATKRFYVKLTDPQDINPDVVGKSVQMSDFIEEELRGREGLGHILPERFAATAKIGGEKYGNIAREVAPANLTPGGELLLPAHALLDPTNPMPQAWSKTLGKNWALNEFVPNYGYWLGKLNYEAGIHPEGHAQNVLVRVSPASGKIFGFVLRDMHDTAIDPFVRALHGKQAVSPNLLDMSILNLQHVDTDRTGAAGLIRSYGSQVLWGLPDDAKFDRFYEGYYRAAKEAAPQIAKDDPYLENPEIWSVEDLTRSIRELNDRTVITMARKAAKSWAPLPRTESINELLKSRIKSRQFGLREPLHPTSIEGIPKKPLRFFSDGNHILALDEKGRPKIILTDLVQWEKERVGIPKGGLPLNLPKPCGTGAFAKIAS